MSKSCARDVNNLNQCLDNHSYYQWQKKVKWQQIDYFKTYHCTFVHYGREKAIVIFIPVMKKPIKPTSPLLDNEKKISKEVISIPTTQEIKAVRKII
jgi:hypothetical protein